MQTSFTNIERKKTPDVVLLDASFGTCTTEPSNEVPLEVGYESSRAKITRHPAPDANSFHVDSPRCALWVFALMAYFSVSLVFRSETLRDWFYATVFCCCYQFVL